ncbi:unnamed protein product [Rhizopus stolonifer]
MCFPLFTALGSLFLLFSFVLELFILIGQLSNKVFLRDLFFGSAWNTGQNTRYNLALWNYCSGDASGTVSSCAHPTPAFNWANTPGMSNMLQSQANSGLINNLFLAMFILFFIACGWSLLIWLASIPICCFRHRAFGYSMSTLTLINFFVMLAALILSLVMVLSGVRDITANEGWNAHAGNLLWITIGATISLLLASIFFSCGSAGGKSRNKKKVKGGDKNGYNDYANFLPYTTDPTYQDNTRGDYANGQYQQQNSETPVTGNQGLTTGSPHPNGAQDHEQITVPHGYQTPTLEPANLPRQN